MKNLFKFTRLCAVSLLLLFGFTQQAWANNGWVFTQMWYNLNGTDSDYKYYNNNGDIDLGTITSEFKLTGLTTEVYDDWWEGSAYKGFYLYWDLKDGSSSASGEHHVTFKTGKTGNNYQFKAENINRTIISYTHASGNYTAEYWFKIEGNSWDEWVKNNGNNCKWTYTILPPAVTEISHSANQGVSGSGTSSDPYIVPLGEDITVTANVTLHHDDANSTTKYSFGGATATTTNTKTVTPTTSLQFFTIDAQNVNNSKAELVGTAGSQVTVYYKATANPTITLECNQSDVKEGTELMLTATPGNTDGTETFQYAYSRNSGVLQNIGTSTSSKTCTFTPSESGSYVFHVTMTYNGETYLANTSAVNVRPVYTLKFKNSNSWVKNIHVWNHSTDEAVTTYPGESLGTPVGKWFTYLFDSKYDRVKVNSGDENGVEIIISGDGCWDIGYSNNSWTATSTSCPDAPNTTTNDPTSIQNTSVTLNGTVASNNEALTDYGFYWGTTNACGTKLQVGTSDKNDSYNKSLTTLAANTTYYYKAYATNAFGTTYGVVKSFTTKYKVTLTNPAKGGSLSQTGTQYIDASGIQVTATPSTGYSFEKWTSTNCNLTNESSDGKKKIVTLVPTADNATLTVSFTEDQWSTTVTSGAHGSVDVTGTMDILQVTGKQLTATADAGYYFTGWTVTGSITPTNSTNATETFKATAAGGTITANFAERWVLRGSKKANDSELGGMPGWNNETAMSVDANGVASVNLTLTPNTDFKFKIRDLKTSSDKGQENTAILPPMTEPSSKWTLNGSNDVYLATVGHGQYTIYVEVDGDNPQVYYSAPISHKITMGTKTTSAGCASGDPGTGGTLTAVDGESYPISDGKYVIANGSVTFTATAYNGYSFEGFYSDATCETQLQAATAGTTYTISNIQENKSVYAKFTERLYNVTYNNGETTTTIQAGIASHPEITAVQKDGRKFTGWETYGVGVANSIAKTTTISYVDMGVNDHRVTATYGDLDKIYFDISKATSWNPTCMYVYFYYHGDYWKNDYGVGTNTGGAYSGTHLEMQKVDPNNNKLWVVYFDPTTIGTGLEYMTRIAFADQNKPNDDEGCTRANKEYFHDCTVSYFDYNQCMNMCVLSNNNGKEPDKRKSDAENRDQYLAWYRNEGFWKNYETPSSGLYVHLHNQGGEIGDGTELNYAEGGGSYSGTVHIDVPSGYDEYNYFFYLGSCDGRNYSADYPITSTNNSHTLNQYETLSQKVTIKVNTTGSYKFIATHNNDNTVTIKVEYPLSVGDFRVVSVIDTKVHDNGYTYKSSTTETEMASFFVKNGATIKLQRCSTIVGTNVTWTDVQSIEISGLDKPGYYNYTITHDGANASIAAAGEYHGNFYLRTDVVAGGWSNYLTNAGNIIQENEYGMNDAQSFKFTHAYTNHVGHGGNVKFVIANDYSKCITDTLVKDDFITEDSGNLPSGKDANVRFMWNKNTNETKRAYIGGSAHTTDRYLILLGNKQETKSLMVDESGNAFPEGGTGRDGLHADEAIFTDLGNWIYQVNIKAFSGAAVKLMADFNGHTQYFVGAAEGENAWRTIMAGSETENPYTMQVVYDFKSNRLVAGFVPDGQEISSDIVLNGDLLILREMQEDAKQIKFGEAAQGQNPYSISQIDHIYCGLQINKGHAGQNDGMIGSTNNDYAKTMYWISFPFDVNINEIFGLDGYGQKWIIQKYNGAERASKGWFKGDGTKTFWEFMDYNETMKAYEGYLFLLDANYFNETNDKVWEIGTVDHITFYFPSANGNIGIINQSSFTQPVSAHKCSIDREFSIGKNDQGEDIMVNHMNTDSYWNVIGVPAFQNKEMALSKTEVDTKMNAIYEWNSSENTYNVKALKTNFEFKTMYAYMVQFGGDITWSDVSVVNNPTKAQGGPAPKYAYADEKNYMIELFFNGNGAEDHTYINLADEASTDFVLNEDMMKIDNAGFPNIYSFAGNYNVAYNETKKDNQTVMLGVSAPKDSNYTFAMPKDFSGTAKLVDLVEGITTDLNVANYSVDLNKGTYNNRFQLVLEVEAKTPTSIEADGQRGREADGKTTKLLRNGEIYLINGGRVYNVLGVEE